MNYKEYNTRRYGRRRKVAKKGGRLRKPTVKYSDRRKSWAKEYSL